MIELNLRIRSLSSRGTNILIGKGIHLPFLMVKNFFSIILSTNLGIGAVISTIPDGSFLLFLTFISPLLVDIPLI